MIYYDDRPVTTDYSCIFSMNSLNSEYKIWYNIYIDVFLHIFSKNLNILNCFVDPRKHLDLQAESAVGVMKSHENPWNLHSKGYAASWHWIWQAFNLSRGRRAPHWDGARREGCERLWVGGSSMGLQLPNSQLPPSRGSVEDPSSNPSTFLNQLTHCN